MGLGPGFDAGGVGADVEEKDVEEFSACCSTIPSSTCVVPLENLLSAKFVPEGLLGGELEVEISENPRCATSR